MPYFHGVYKGDIGHCVKSVEIRSFFRSVFSHVRTEYRKKRTRINSVFGNFLRSRNGMDEFVSRQKFFPLIHFERM